jgi:hypothetical protein
MKNVRIGIVGLGNMGAAHATNILAGKIPRLELTAVSDFDPARCTRFPQAKAFATVEDMIKSGLIDALIIATPHYQHTTLGIGNSREIILGEVLHAHFAPGIVDPATLHVDPEALDALGRMGGQGYARTRDRFDLPTMTVAQWEAGAIATRSKG